MMIAGMFLLRRDRRELNDLGLLEDLVGDFIRIRPFCLRGFAVCCLFVPVAGRFFLGRLGGLLDRAVVAGSFLSGGFSAGFFFLFLCWLRFFQVASWQKIDVERCRRIGSA